MTGRGRRKALESRRNTKRLSVEICGHEARVKRSVGTRSQLRNGAVQRGLGDVSPTSKMKGPPAGGLFIVARWVPPCIACWSFPLLCWRSAVPVSTNRKLSPREKFREIRDSFDSTVCADDSCLPAISNPALATSIRVIRIRCYCIRARSFFDIR